ncbi:MAG: hypothetical protein KF894_18850 [Labilithrix sp.]|nr:hypothetical protein [Labilithrix sp.]
MTSAPEYRSAGSAIATRGRELREESARLRLRSPIRRAVLPPGTVRELDGLAARIDVALERATSLEALSAIGELVLQLSVVAARAEEELDRMRSREREHPCPDAPKRFTLGSPRATFSIERPFRAQLGHLNDVRGHGVGMLGRFDHEGAPFTLVACGVKLRDWPSTALSRFECLLRTSVPRGPALTIRPRTLLRRLVPSRDAVTVEPTFDRAFVVHGDPSVARALLDERYRALLLAIRHELRGVVVGEGVLDVVWRRRFVAGARIASDEALAVAHAIAARLYAA